MGEGEVMMINAMKRSFKVPECLSAFIVTGTEKVRCGFGNGDCLLLDLSNNIFAVADGSERYPWASRELLERLKDKLSSTTGLPEADVFSNSISEIYAMQKYNHKTTMSCISLTEDNEGVSVAIANGGDSSVVIYDTRNCSIVYKTEVDMNFAGRSISEPDIVNIRLEEKSCRVLLATDGLFDLLKHYDNRSAETLPEIFSCEEVHLIADELQHKLELLSDHYEYDDIGVIVIDPFNTGIGQNMSVLMGGTTSLEETRFRENERLLNSSEWLCDHQWQEHMSLIRDAGIEIFKQGI